MSEKTKRKPPESILLNEIQLLLAEKNTNFSLFRTGIAVTTLPLTVAIFLVATESYHHAFENKIYLLMIVLVLLGVVAGGAFMTIFASRKIKKIDAAILKIENENKRVENIIV
jgi:hypothetical protein